jgi:protein phosphatase
VRCLHCGAESADPSFCDHCNLELAPEVARRTIADLEFLKPFVLSAVVDEDEVHGIRRYEGAGDSGPVCVFEIERDPATFESNVATLGADVLPEINAVETSDPLGHRWFVARMSKGRGAWLAGMTNLALSDRDNETERALALIAATVPLLQPLKALHARDQVWIDFDPRDVVPTGLGHDLRLLKPSGRLITPGTLPAKIRLVPEYAAPEIENFRAQDVGPRSDVFHVGALLHALLGQRPPRGAARVEVGVFRLPPLRIFRPTIPPGIDHALRRATAPDPGMRYASIVELERALEDVAAELRKRRAPGHLVAEWASATAIGQIKGQLYPINQDAVFPAKPGEGASVVAAIADGVSNCRVGRGERAAELTIAAVRAAALAQADHHLEVARAALQRSRGEETPADSFSARKVLQNLPAMATTALLAELPGEQNDLSGVMTSTLVAVWLEAGIATVANLGDSRCYLVTSSYEEQLTRDDDVETLELARGTPPSEIAEIPELERKALRRLVGALRRTASGMPEPDAERIAPTIMEFGLTPDDTLLLCSDGLVEEGLFLTAHEAAQIIRDGARDSLAEVAQRLVRAADARQRPPKNGDNVSCVVVRMRETQPAGGAHG